MVTIIVMKVMRIMMRATWHLRPSFLILRFPRLLGSHSLATFPFSSILSELLPPWDTACQQLRPLEFWQWQWSIHSSVGFSSDTFSFSPQPQSYQSYPLTCFLKNYKELTVYTPKLNHGNDFWTKKK